MPNRHITVPAAADILDIDDKPIESMIFLKTVRAICTHPAMKALSLEVTMLVGDIRSSSVGDVVMCGDDVWAPLCAATKEARSVFSNPMVCDSLGSHFRAILDATTTDPRAAR